MKKLKNLLLILFTVVPISMYAQDSIKSVNLNDVTITASRFKSESITASVIETDSLKNYYAQETPAVFSKTPSVVSQTDNGSPFGYSYFTLRGMSQTRINYTLNGVPLNDGEDLAVYTSNYTDLLSSTRSFQLIRGAGVSTNGASSYIGLVNMDMSSPFDSTGGYVTGSYGSFKSYRAAFKYTISPKNGWGATIRSSFTGSDGFRDYSSGNSFSTSASVGWKDPKTSIRFNGVYGTTENGQSWLPVPEGSDPKTNILVGGNIGPQKDNFKSQIYQLQFSRILSDNLILNASPYFTSVRGNYDFPLDTSVTGNLALNSANYGGYLNFKLLTRELTLQPGINFNLFNREHIFTSPYGDYKNIGYKNDFSGFVKASYITRKLVINGDFQARNASFEYKGSELTKKFFNHTFYNFSVGISYTTKHFQPYISYGRTTREPSRTDLFGYNDNIDNSNIDMVNDVKPETVNDIEYGTKFTYKKLRGSFNLYTMFFNNEILSINQMNYLGIVLRKNVNKSQRFGIEGELVYSPCKFIDMGTSFNLSRNRVWINEEQKEPLLTPTCIVNAYTIFNVRSLSLGVDYKYVSQAFLESSNSTNFILPACHFLNTSVSYSLTNDFTVSVVINNLLDKNWTPSGNVTTDEIGNPVSRNFFYTSGINGYLTIKYTFLK